MSKQKRLVAPLFSGIADKVDTFISIDNDIPIDDNLKKYKDLYTGLISDIKFILEDLSTLEEAIIQSRCMNDNVIRDNMSLFLNKNKYGTYIYAITLFYTKHDALKEIRVFIGNTSKFGSNIESLYKDPDFMSMCADKLKSKMSEELAVTLLKFQYSEDKRNYDEMELYENGNQI